MDLRCVRFRFFSRFFRFFRFILRLTLFTIGIIRFLLNCSSLFFFVVSIFALRRVFILFIFCIISFVKFFTFGFLSYGRNKLGEWVKFLSHRRIEKINESSKRRRFTFIFWFHQVLHNYGIFIVFHFFQ